MRGENGLLGSSSDFHMFLMAYSCMRAHREKQQRRKQRDREVGRKEIVKPRGTKAT